VAMLGRWSFPGMLPPNVTLKRERAPAGAPWPMPLPPDDARQKAACEKWPEDCWAAAVTPSFGRRMRAGKPLVPAGSVLPWRPARASGGFRREGERAGKAPVDTTAPGAAAATPPVNIGCADGAPAAGALLSDLPSAVPSGNAVPPPPDDCCSPPTPPHRGTCAHTAEPSQQAKRKRHRLLLVEPRTRQRLREQQQQQQRQKRLQQSVPEEQQNEVLVEELSAVPPSLTIQSVPLPPRQPAHQPQQRRQHEQQAGDWDIGAGGGHCDTALTRRQMQSIRMMSTSPAAPQTTMKSGTAMESSKGNTFREGARRTLLQEGDESTTELIQRCSGLGDAPGSQLGASTGNPDGSTAERGSDDRGGVALACRAIAAPVCSKGVARATFVHTNEKDGAQAVVTPQRLSNLRAGSYALVTTCAHVRLCSVS
jgi:hypothetical protein